MLKVHEKAEEARNMFLESFDAAGDKFLAVLIVPEGNDGVACHKTSFDFPNNLRIKALRELLNVFVMEDAEDKPAPLPFAPFLIPREDFEALRAKAIQPIEQETAEEEPTVKSEEGDDDPWDA